MRVLLVEDSRRLRDYVAEGLRQTGYAVDLAADGEQGWWAVENTAYDTVILDIMLPKLDGLALLARMREKGIATHVLMLTAKDKVEDRVQGLSQGADDYLVKPFAMEELIARVQALTRRCYGTKSPVVTTGSVTIDMAQRAAFRAGAPLALKPREYALLEYLMLRKGTVVSRTEIEHHIYDEHVEPVSNVVDSAICRLRRQIDAPGAPSMIQTKRGMGYLLVDGTP